MLGSVRRLAGQVLRMAAGTPLRALPAHLRADVLGALVEETVVAGRTHGRELRMVCAAPLPLARAQTLLTKEPETIAWLDELPHDAVLWDVGANVGAFTLYGALAAQRTVLAFEPSAANYALLCQNVRLNALDNVRAYCLAFARDTRLGVLNQSSPMPGAAVSQFGAVGEVSRYAEAKGRNTVQGMIGFSLDDFVARFTPPFPTHLKIDVDGLEWSILQGASSTLADPRLRSVLMELTISDPPELERAVAFLAERGLALTTTGATQHAGAHSGRNHLFHRAPGP